MKETVTVKKNYEFRRMYAKGTSAAAPRMVLYYRKNHRKSNRLGVTVSTKLGKAVVRNRIKRQIREIFRLAQPEMKQGYDVILVARGRAVGATYQDLADHFFRLCRRLDLLQENEA